jgi:alkaline phosphatase D
MLGAEQEDWLAGALDASVKAGKPWQVLANQVIMARVKPPRLNQTLSPAQKAVDRGPRLRGLAGLAEFGQPLNLDAWDGFPAARERLYASAKAAGANLVTLTGDTHTGWANELSDGAGEARGVEFGCTSVTSPGFGQFYPDVPTMGAMFEAANQDVVWHDPNGSGYTILTMTKDDVRADFYKVSDVRQSNYTSSRVSSFRTERTSKGKLRRV